LNRHQRFLYLAVFTAGLTTLGIELSASRLLGSVFGTSNLVWANIIGLILVYLTVGYFLGGRLADRSPHYETFYRLLCWAAFSAGLVPLVARPVLFAAARAVLNINAAVLVGSFGGVLILFSVPVTLLGMVSPFAIRLAIQDTEAAGRISGRIYAISTLGSILGTFAPVLLLIPAIGTLRTFLSLSGLLMLVALGGLATHHRRAALRLLWMPVVLIGLAMLALRGPLKPPPDEDATVIFEGESAYNYIQVAEWHGTRYLFLNEGLGLHSIYNPDQLYTGMTWDYFLAAPYFNPPPYTPDQVRSLALVGLAAGTISRQYTAVYGPIPIDGIEIDPEIVRVGRHYFAMNQPNLNVVVEDGRYALASSRSRYDVIGVDAYRLPYIPWHLATREFFQEARDHLTERGVVVINVGRTASDRRLVEALAATLGAVFPSVHVMDVPQACNSILVATVQPSAPENLLDNLALMDDQTHVLLRISVQAAYDNLAPTPSGGPVFTDDRTSIEQLTDSILVNFALSGQTEMPCQ
jgi:predicted membrane-bound spermidine synthase